MKPEFLTDLEVKDLSDGRWELVQPLVYNSGLYPNTITVPAGFVTDFASVPRVPVIYSLFGDRAHRESVVHDYLYQTHLASKADADRIFLEAMKLRQKPLFVRWGMYLGVKLGGASSYESGPERFTVLNLR